jgi:hypothetical protein
MTSQLSGVLPPFYDMLDGFTEGNPIECLATDCDFEMSFPGSAEIPNERFAGGKEDFRRFMHHFEAMGGRFQHTATQRRHNITTLTHVDGLELMVGEGKGGRRNGSLVAAAQEDREGKLRRYLVVMSTVEFPELQDRLEPNSHPPILPRFFDLLDGVAKGDPVDLLADDFQFEMVFPGLDGPYDERIAGGKAEFKQFLDDLSARNPELQPGVERRLHIQTLTVVDGLEIMLGTASGGRRNGTILAAAQQDQNGKLRRYAVVMSSVKFPTTQD